MDDHGVWFFAIRGATKTPNLQCIIVSDLPMIPRKTKKTCTWDLDGTGCQMLVFSSDLKNFCPSLVWWIRGYKRDPAEMNSWYLIILIVIVTQFLPWNTIKTALTGFRPSEKHPTWMRSRILLPSDVKPLTSPSGFTYLTWHCPSWEDDWWVSHGFPGTQPSWNMSRAKWCRCLSGKSHGPWDGMVAALKRRGSN